MKKYFWSRGAKIFYALAGLAFVGTAGWVAYRINAQDSGMLQVGMPAGNWSLQTPAGETISFYEHSGDKPSLILFWATWCSSCGKVMPELAKLQASLPEGAVNFYALNVSEDGDPVAYFKEHGYRFHLLLNADQVETSYGTFGTPRIFLVDGAKTVRYTKSATSTVDQTIEQLKSVLSALGSMPSGT